MKKLTLKVNNQVYLKLEHKYHFPSFINTGSMNFIILLLSVKLLLIVFGFHPCDKVDSYCSHF